MAEYNVHITKYEHNKRFSNELINKNDNYSDWQTVAIFYAALHLVEAIFSKKYNEHTYKHSVRSAYMCEHYDVFSRNAMKCYNKLQNLSSKARYTDIIKDDEDYYCAKEYLENFDEEVIRFIE